MYFYLCLPHYIEVEIELESSIALNFLFLDVDAMKENYIARSYLHAFMANFFLLVLRVCLLKL